MTCYGNFCSPRHPFQLRRVSRGSDSATRNSATWLASGVVSGDRCGPSRGYVGTSSRNSFAYGRDVLASKLLSWQENAQTSSFTMNHLQSCVCGSCDFLWKRRTELLVRSEVPLATAIIKHFLSMCCNGSTAIHALDSHLGHVFGPHVLHTCLHAGCWCAPHFMKTTCSFTMFSWSQRTLESMCRVRESPFSFHDSQDQRWHHCVMTS